MNDRDIRFDIVARNIKFNEVWHQVFTLNEIWDGSTIDTWLKSSNCEMLAKRLWTGLKDRNGLGIYEGDIIARYWSDGSVLQQFEVRWFVDKCGYAINPALLESTRHNQQTGMTAHGFTVIGNIYDNPELLR